MTRMNLQVVTVAACVGDATGRANWWICTSQAQEAKGSQRGHGVVPTVEARPDKDTVQATYPCKPSYFSFKH